MLPHDAGDGLPATTGSGVALLEDLKGATFSPPISASRTTLTDDSGWSQSVAIDTVRLDDPTTLAPDPTSTATLLRLTVTIKEDRTDRGSYVWWLNP